MKIKHTYILLAMALVVFMGCSDDDGPLAIPHIRQAETQTPPTPSFTSGSADFSTYVSVGNSLTAGFSDNALFAKGQAVSFPKILSERLALAAGSGFAFTQPMMADDVGGLLLGGQQIAGPRLIFDAQAQVPVPFPGTPTTEVTNILSGPFNNMGVPGAKSYHLLAEGYGN
ncbi:MAG: G-D-S-L family lipolytic protein, partial [Flavobacteriaceae bacterium]